MYTLYPEDPSPKAAAFRSAHNLLPSPRVLHCISWGPSPPRLCPAPPCFEPHIQLPRRCSAHRPSSFCALFPPHRDCLDHSSVLQPASCLRPCSPTSIRLILIFPEYQWKHATPLVMPLHSLPLHSIECEPNTLKQDPDLRCWYRPSPPPIRSDAPTSPPPRPPSGHTGLLSLSNSTLSP